MNEQEKPLSNSETPVQLPALRRRERLVVVLDERADVELDEGVAVGRLGRGELHHQVEEPLLRQLEAGLGRLAQRGRDEVEEREAVPVVEGGAG